MRKPNTITVEVNNYIVRILFSIILLCIFLCQSCSKIPFENTEPESKLFELLKISNTELRNVADKVERNILLKKKINEKYGKLKWSNGIQINDKLFLVPITDVNDSLKAVVQFEQKLGTYYYNVITPWIINNSETIDPNLNLFKFFKDALKSNKTLKILKNDELTFTINHKHIKSLSRTLDDSVQSRDNQICWTTPWCEYGDTPECANGCDLCPLCVVRDCYTTDPGPAGGGGSCGPNGTHCESVEPSSGGGGGGGNTPSSQGGWSLVAPFDKLCFSSINFISGSQNSYWETNVMGLKFEASVAQTNNFSAYYSLPNDITDAAMNLVIYPSPFGPNVPPKTALQYIEDFFPSLFDDGDIVKIWDVQISKYVWRFSKFATQKISVRCSNIAALIVRGEYPTSCFIPFFTPAQISFRLKTEGMLKCFIPNAVCRLSPSLSSNTSFATYSPTCN